MSSEKEESSSTVKRKLSCFEHFDALWFCYSPVYQMKQYYRLGTLDNCRGKWKAWTDCLMLKTKPKSQVEEVLEAREKSKKPHIWNFRTRYEASQNWQKMYGHLDKPEWGKSFCTNELLLPYNFTGGLEKETFRDQIKFIPNWRYQKARISFLFSAEPSHCFLNWEDLAY